MAAVQEKIITPQEYLAEERKRSREEGKFEYINYQLIFMPGASTHYNIICHNLYSK